MITAPHIERFSPKVDRHQFMILLLKILSFMKFCALLLELHLPQKFCHIHTDKQTDRETEILQKWSIRVQDIPKRVNPSKTGSRKF